MLSERGVRALRHSADRRSRLVNPGAKESDVPGSTRRLGRIGEGSPSASAGDFLGESPKKVIPGKVQEPRAPKANAGGPMRTSSGQFTSAALERERERVTRLQQELAEEREAR